MSAELIAALERALGSQWLSIDHASNRTQEARDIRRQMCEAVDRAKAANPPIIKMGIIYFSPLTTVRELSTFMAPTAELRP